MGLFLIGCNSYDLCISSAVINGKLIQRLQLYCIKFAKLRNFNAFFNAVYIGAKPGIRNYAGASTPLQGKLYPSTNQKFVFQIAYP